MEVTSNMISFLDQSLQNTWKTDGYIIIENNDAIGTTPTWEQNQNDFNQVWLEMLINGQETPDQTQAALLSNIANQCPYAGGEAVFQARALLGEGYAYDDGTLCGTGQQGLIKRQPGEELVFEVYPNPAAVFFTVELEEKTATDGRAVISDALGRHIVSLAIGKGAQEFYLMVDKVPAGLYILTIKVDGKTAAKPVSIIK